jgi:hypothetical protein
MPQLEASDSTDSVDMDIIFSLESPDALSHAVISALTQRLKLSLHFDRGLCFL